MLFVNAFLPKFGFGSSHRLPASQIRAPINASLCSQLLMLKRAKPSTDLELSCLQQELEEQKLEVKKLRRMNEVLKLENESLHVQRFELSQQLSEYRSELHWARRQLDMAVAMVGEDSF